ncbi:hypothetical protein TIFTF001_025749 [Ficus carica]|uniref:Uncharacterized protein n=1 Tax=Ficus carica TaxID=3494 RepID=A0AA88DEG8_FICCA|nr:hypothetical protein TIFTF001_025749 [Ficus carica]
MFFQNPQAGNCSGEKKTPDLYSGGGERRSCPQWLFFEKPTGWQTRTTAHRDLQIQRLSPILRRDSLAPPSETVDFIVIPRDLSRDCPRGPLTVGLKSISSAILGQGDGGWSVEGLPDFGSPTTLF